MMLMQVWAVHTQRPAETARPLAVEIWLQRNRVITITQNKKVLPVFLEQFAHNCAHKLKEVVIMHRWLTVLFVFTFVMSASTVFSQTKPASGAQYLTVQDVEKITGLHGIKLVPANPSKGAGGDLNFANKDGELILMVQRMLYSDALYSQTKKMKGTVKADIEGVGDGAFTGPAGGLQYFVSFRKGKGSGSAATFLTITGGTQLPLDQVKKVAQQIASGM
jgi:hypothetical protein